VQFDYHERFAQIGKLALLGQGIEPGMVDYFARYAADHFFDEVQEMGVRDGATLDLPGHKGMAFVFDPWSTMDECTEPALVWEAGKGYYEVEPFSEIEEFLFPGGIGVQELGHVQHDEVIHIARNAHLLKGVRKATFKYGVGQEFINAIEVLRSLNLTKKDTVTFKGAEIAPRDFVAAVCPDPAQLCRDLVGRTCSGLWVKGTRDGLERELYFYQVADAQEVLERFGTQVITCQTAFTAVITLELLGGGKLAGYRGNPESGVRSPEEFCADPYIALMARYEFPGGVMEMDSEFKIAMERGAMMAPLR